ncbi:MAG: hypothetical protein ABSE80_02135 [Halobacteriota archaeon]|jgi:hypothetical protein
MDLRNGEDIAKTVLDNLSKIKKTDVAKLDNLSKIVKTEILKGSFDTIQREYVRREVDEFDYEKGRPLHFRLTRFIKEELSRTGVKQLLTWLQQFDDYKSNPLGFQKIWDIEDFMSPTYSLTKSYERIYDPIDQMAKANEYSELAYGVSMSGTNTRILSSLLDHVLLFAVPKAPVEDMSQSEFVAFVTDVINTWFSPFQVSIWVNAVSIEATSVKDSGCTPVEGLTIRCPQPRDFEFELPLDFLQADGYLTKDYFQNNPPDCIIDSTADALWFACGPCEEQNPNCTNNNCQIVNLLVCLRLFELGCPSLIFVRDDNMLPLKHDDTYLRSPGFKFHPLYEYSIPYHEFASIADFFRDIMPLLPKPREKLRNQKRSNPDIIIQTALDRYFESLGQDETTAHRVSSAIMCLEALYLNDSQELAYKLRLRVSGLLRIAGFNPLIVVKDIKDAYNVRSGFVHSSHNKEKDSAKADELARRVADYARASLLIFLQLKKALDEKNILENGYGLKDGIIAMLDESFVDLEQYAGLQFLLLEHCRFF